jgi:DNA-binding transcriptional MocR family regulator
MHTEMLAFINSHVRLQLFLGQPRRLDFYCGTNQSSQLQANAHALTYGDGFSGSHNVKESLCRFMNSQFSPRSTLYPSHLVITSGVSNAIECCAWALADHGDFVMVGRPYFNAFRTTFGIRPG